MTQTFNKSEIMTKAWDLVKKFGYTLSEALKIAWHNAKLIAMVVMASASEAVHTWYGWTQLGREVIHESVCYAQVTIIDPSTKKGTRVLSYFRQSQTCPLGSQD